MDFTRFYGRAIVRRMFFVLFGSGDEYWDGTSDPLWADDGKQVSSYEG